MTLRAVNTPLAAQTIMQALASVLIANTSFQQTGNTPLVNDDSSLVTEQGPWPALLLEDNGQTREKVGWQLWKPRLGVLVTYMDLYDAQTTNFQMMWDEIDIDLQRMLANLEDNPRLNVASVPAVMGILRMEISPYANKAMERERYGDIPVVQRFATLTLALTPYISAQ